MFVDVFVGVAAVGESVAGVSRSAEESLAADASDMSCMPISAKAGTGGPSSCDSVQRDA